MLSQTPRGSQVSVPYWCNKLHTERLDFLFFFTFGSFWTRESVINPQSADQLDRRSSEGLQIASTVGEDLRASFGALLDSIPNCSMRPTQLARKLDVSRVMISRVMSSIGKENSADILTSIPGPETLRAIVRSAQGLGVDQLLTNNGRVAIDAFDSLIRDQFGTRVALNAALSTLHSDSLDKFEQSGRYQVFKGMSQILGVESKIWLTCMMLTPSKEQKNAIDITTIHGTSGLRRLRPDMPVLLSYGVPPKHRFDNQSPSQLGLDLSQFFSHTPAPLTAVEENGQVINTFAPVIEGKDSLYDLISSVSIPGGIHRYAAPGRSKRGTSVIPDVPVATLVSDVVLYKDIFENTDPQLFVYKTMGKGGADIEDPLRDIDRVVTSDQIKSLGVGLSELRISEVPKYQEMVRYLSEHNGYEPDDFRTYRLQVQYPVIGFQYVMAFDVPEGDEVGPSECTSLDIR